MTSSSKSYLSVSPTQLASFRRNVDKILLKKLDIFIVA